MSLYQRIGEETVQGIIAEFYQRAFADKIIGHFFFGKNKEQLVQMQTAFAVNLLGGPKKYNGRPLEVVHSEFSIRPAHFDRRQIILRDVMTDFALAKHEIDEWLVLENNLRTLIITVVEACGDTKLAANI